MNEEVCRILLSIQENISCAVLPSAIYKPELNFCKNTRIWRAYYGDGNFFGLEIPRPRQ